MSQTIRQQARRQALDVAAKRRRERQERERRLEDLMVQVLTAVGERDAAIAEADRRAGEALREMTEREGLTLREAVEWFDGQVSLREATRLRRLADGDKASDDAGPRDESVAESERVGGGATTE
jgi:hypothetical protein